MTGTSKHFQKLWLDFNRGWQHILVLLGSLIVHLIDCTPEEGSVKLVDDGEQEFPWNPLSGIISKVRKVGHHGLVVLDNIINCGNIKTFDALNIYRRHLMAVEEFLRSTEDLLHELDGTSTIGW